MGQRLPSNLEEKCSFGESARTRHSPRGNIHQTFIFLTLFNLAKRVLEKDRRCARPGDRWGAAYKF